VTFGREFTAAVEAKQVAAQEAERAKFVVEKAKQDKRSAIIRAQQKKREMVSSAFGEDDTGGLQTRLTVEDLEYLFQG
ncbi:prohibitin-1, mitochondrial-like protein, partial [Tanacetum coccineum]